MEEPTEDVLRFIEDRIDTVPQIEILLLLWENRGGTYTAGQLAARTFLSEDATIEVLKELQRRKFVTASADGSLYAYDSAWDPAGEFMARVAATYRQHLVRVATLIHAKASPAVREFARAFAPKKEK
jgi:DNA-binding IclR family transcriptional regulator